MDGFGLLFAFVLLTIIFLALREVIRRRVYTSRWGVFASHRSKDNQVIVPVIKKLRDENLRVWCDMSELDEIHLQNDGFRHPISVGMQNSTFALLFTSKEYLGSKYCMEEAALFLKRFAKEPERIIEIPLDENKVRSTLKFPESVSKIDVLSIAPSEENAEQHEKLVGKILSHIRTQQSLKGIPENELFFESPTPDYDEQRKRLIEDARLCAYAQGKSLEDLEREIERIVSRFKPKMEGESIASSVDGIPTHSKEIAEKLLDYPPEVGAYLALLTFGGFLMREKLGRSPLANLMLALESMHTLNYRRQKAAAELLTRALCMMNSKKIAFDTYSSMVDFRMKSLVRERLLELNRKTWEGFLEQETKRTRALVERLIDEIKDKTFPWGHRQRAVETLGTLGDTRAVEPILALIGAESDIHQTAIIESLKKLGDPRAVEVFLAFLSSKNPYEQGYAAEALGELRERRALIPLIKTLQENEEYFARRKVIWALGNLGDKRASEPLRETLQDILMDGSISQDLKGFLQEEIRKALEKINTE